MGKKILIVGGVAGGASVAARLRRLDENAAIIMFERGKYISYANCGLPYYIGGTIQDREALLVQTPASMNERFNIDIRVQNEVTKINRQDKIVEVKNIRTGEIYNEEYDVLVLSPGSTPLKPNIKGINSPNIFTLWTVPDTDNIKNFINSNKPKRAAVIGGGFIGIEMAENLHDQGLEVSIIEMQNQLMTTMDTEMAQIIHQHISSQDIRLHLSNGVKEFNYSEGVTKIILQDNRVVEADIVILCIGIRPNSELAKDADLELNERGKIVVDEYLKTNDENIYALGDAIVGIPLAGPANKQGRIVANNICGKKEKYKGTQGTSIVKVFDLTVASTGLNEKQLNAMGKDYKKDYKITYVQPKSHAGYYPGAIPMTIKLIFDLAGNILGSQIIGYDGVDKRIDVIATTLKLNGTIYDLKELELAYAPPYSSAKDPVNMAGFTAENILEGIVDVILCRELKEINLNDTIILDVRDEIETQLGIIENSINIPVNQLRNNLDKLDKNKLIIIYCAIGLRGYIAARILMQNGFKVKNLIGGYNLYKHYISNFKGYINKHNIDNSNNNQVENKKEPKNMQTSNTIKLNACGLQCPGPIMQVYNKMKELNEGDILEVSATDPGFPIDAKAWCQKTHNEFIKSEKKSKEFVVWIRKGNIITNIKQRDGKTMIVFSGDLDKAIASFIIANGAAAMGKPVTMFFTFWGLNILRKHNRVKVNKNMVERMFGAMMPRGTKRLKLSNMNMGGMGARMIRKVMKDKNVDSLEDLIEMAIKSGVRVVACTMSMDVMGIKKEELIDGIELGGVASYLGAADDSNVNLFI